LEHASGLVQQSKELWNERASEWLERLLQAEPEQRQKLAGKERWSGHSLP
jgi:hypothetical protein